MARQPGHCAVTGEEFKRRRESLRLTQHQIGALFGVTRNTVQNWEAGLFKPPHVAHYAFDAWDQMSNWELNDVLAHQCS